MKSSHRIQQARKKHVVHVLTSLDFGGVEKRMETLARASHQSSAKHCFWAIGRGGATEHKIVHLNCCVKCLALPVSIPSLRTILTLTRMFRQVRPDVVQTHGAEANFHGLIAARLSGVPVRIGEEIGLPSHSWKAKLVFRQVYRCAQRVIGVSNSVTSWLIANAEISQSKAVSMVSPVDIPKTIVARRDSSLTTFRIGFVGRLQPLKNPLVLIEAVSRLRSEGVPAEVLLIGDGTQREMLEERAVQFGVVRHVQFLGYCDNPASWVCECDIYVQPSISEGFSIALVEAMGCGVPVLATAVGGAPEIIDDGHTGWLLESSSADHVVAALRRAWRDRRELAAIGEAGRSAVLTRFDPARYVRELDALYEEVQRDSVSH